MWIHGRKIGIGSVIVAVVMALVLVGVGAGMTLGKPDPFIPVMAGAILTLIVAGCWWVFGGLVEALRVEVEIGEAKTSRTDEA